MTITVVAGITWKESMDPSLDWLDVEGSHAIRAATESPTEAFLDRKKDYAAAERMPRSSIGFGVCGHSGRTRMSAPRAVSLRQPF